MLLKEEVCCPYILFVTVMHKQFFILAGLTGNPVRILVFSSHKLYHLFEFMRSISFVVEENYCGFAVRVEFIATKATS